MSAEWNIACQCIRCGGSRCVADWNTVGGFRCVDCGAAVEPFCDHCYRQWWRFEISFHQMRRGTLPDPHGCGVLCDEHYFWDGAWASAS